MQSLNYVTLFNYRCDPSASDNAFKGRIFSPWNFTKDHGNLLRYVDPESISLLFHFSFSNSTTFTREVRLKKFLRENLGMWYFLDKYWFQWIDGVKWIKSMISTSNYKNYKSKSKFFKNLNRWKSTNLLIIS